MKSSLRFAYRTSSDQCLSLALQPGLIDCRKLREYSTVVIAAFAALAAIAAIAVTVELAALAVIVELAVIAAFAAFAVIAAFVAFVAFAAFVAFVAFAELLPGVRQSSIQGRS